MKNFNRIAMKPFITMVVLLISLASYAQVKVDSLSKQNFLSIAANYDYGSIIQPELIIDRLSIVGGIGVYALHLHYGSFNQTYQRLGVRYDIYKNFSLGVNVRAVNFAC